MSEVQELETTAPADTAKNVKALQKIFNGLEKFIEKNQKPVPDCTTDDGLAEAKRLQKLFAEPRIQAEKLHETVKAFYWKNGKLVDSMKNDILGAVEPVETTYKAAIKAEKDRVKRIEEEAAAKIKAEEDAMEARFQAIRDLLGAVDLDSINKAIETLNTLDIQPFQDRAEEAEELAEQVLAELTKRKAELEKQAEKEAFLKAEADRLEAEKQAAEQERLAAQEKQRAEQAEIDRQKAEIEAEKQKVANAAAIAEAELKAQEKANREKAEAVEQAKKDEQQRIENERIAAEQKAAAEKAEAERLAALAPSAEKLRAWFNSLPELAAIDSKDADAVEVHAKLLDHLNNMDDLTAGLVNKTQEAA